VISPNGRGACSPIGYSVAAFINTSYFHLLAVLAWPLPRKLAILIAMSVAEQMSLADVKNRLSEVVDRLQKEHGRVVITRHGHPAAVVISLDDLESLEETLDVMDGAALLNDIREALADTDAQVLSKDDAVRLIPGR
jgi:antitoxin YefM